MKIKSFRELIDAAEGMHEQLVIYHVATDDRVAELVVRGLLLEAIPRVDLGKGRSILFHKAHVPNTQDHLLFVVKGDKIAAVNKSGSAHDQSHGYQLQKWALDGAKKYYPDFTMPDDGLIEAVLVGSGGGSLLTEAFDAPVLVPLTDQVSAIMKAGDYFNGA